jgi:hypothetical protein
MKLTDAIKKTGKPYKIPNCSRNELPGFFKSLGFKKGAEIGVDQGEFTQKFLDEGLNMYAIDPWHNRERTYQRVRSRFQQYKNCQIIRKTSMEAIHDFTARSLDFVYIDADHRFPFVAQDLYYWYWRIKKGGILAGHDYKDTRPGSPDRAIQIQVLVDAFVKSFNIGNYYIFGRTKPLARERLDDKMLSFMFFKNW